MLYLRTVPNLFMAATILIIGFSGLVAQVLLLRELLISYLGNELTLGIILANWLIAEALGVFIAGKLIDKTRSKISLFVLLQTIFSISLPASIYLARSFKSLSHIPSGESLSLTAIFLSSFIILLPTGFSHAGLFSSSCRIFSLNRTKEEQPESIAMIYALEIIGTIIAGVTLTYFLLVRFNAFQIAFPVSIAGLLVNLAYLKLPEQRLSRAINLSLTGIFIYLSISAAPIIQNTSLNQQFKPGNILGYENSLYANIAVIEKDTQLTYFYNGAPTITLPCPDIAFNEEFGNFPLFLQGAPKTILVIEGGTSGLINEILKHPVEKIVYLALDPAIIKTLNKFSAQDTTTGLSDSRVKVINQDARQYFNETCEKFDVILVGLTNPASLSINRLFTDEFFKSARLKLNAGGILSFCLPGSLTYLSKELRGLNAGILNALKINFTYTHVLPGDLNMFFASPSKDIANPSAEEIIGRIKQSGIKINLLLPEYVNYRFGKERSFWFNQEISKTTQAVNRDFKPLAVFQSILLWNKQFSNTGLRKSLLVIIFILILGFIFLLRKRYKIKEAAIAYAIASTGFFGMITSLIIIFIFQLRFGYIYREIAIITSLFMAGSALASLIALKNFRNKSLSLQTCLIKTETGIIIFILCLIFSLKPLISLSFAYPALLFISIIAGFFVGLEFAWAGKIFISADKQAGETSGLLYFADLSGGAAAGIIGGILLFPLIGIINTCIILILLKLTSLSLLYAYRNS